MTAIEELREYLETKREKIPMIVHNSLAILSRVEEDHKQSGREQYEMGYNCAQASYGGPKLLELTLELQEQLTTLREQVKKALRCFDRVLHAYDMANGFDEGIETLLQAIEEVVK
jgi:hypothetical protein